MNKNIKNLLRNLILQQCLAIILTPENPKKNQCKLCDFVTFNKKDFKRHIETIKYKFNINQQESMIFTQNYPKNCLYKFMEYYKNQNI